ncbi:hypothetical protein BBJ29_001206 [Phytophthora kernoviae]|uniref:Mediator of RNA polymerase II transcription subunit 14 n=1 Tax=Phytophthora kernoviae TaxID=325452 RepID=A0A3F2RPR7_9STRA|nr:hypothetical protein BBJ29_001206 [Phytophthora kernoviae]RLN61810.1 hypothetical protein BBP00_00005172 [Phytophthora kernoviae]
MGDFPPPEHTSVRANELVHRAVDKSYEDFRTLMHQLPTMREEERREPLLAHLQSSRKRFAQLLAVLKWSVQAPLLQQCDSLLQQADAYRNNVNETNDRLFFMHADLNRAKERRYDLSTAVDVLYEGSYLRLPTIIKNAMFPRELPEVDTEQAATEVADIIRFRLIETVIPEQFTNIKLEDGFVTCQAEGEFELVLTIQGKEKDAKWRVISVNTTLTDPQAFEDHSKAASTSALRIIRTNAPNAAHYNHLKNLVQRAMNKSEKPFVDAFKVMREFCSSLALQILFSQGKLLMEGRWKNRIMIKHHRDQNVLDICYWPKACTRKETQALTEQQRLLQQLSEPIAASRKGSSLPFPESSLCVRLSFDPNQKKLLSVSLSPSLPPNLPGFATLLSALEVPSNMFLLSAENLLIAAMRAHVSAALFSVDTSLRIARSDIGGLQQFVEVTFDIREGRFIVSSVAAAKRAALYSTVKQLERILNTQCKIELGGNVDKSFPNDFALVSGDGKGEKSNEMIHASVRKVLCEIVADEVAQIGSSFKGIEILRNINLNWERYLAFRQQHGGQTEDLSISDTALYFQLTSSKESTCYLVIEIDKYGEVDGMNGNVHEAAEMEEYLQHFVNFARRRKSRIRYSGEAGTSNKEGTGGQVVTLSFPEKVNTDPLKIVAIQGHLKHGGGENPLELFMVELICVVRPLCELAVKLEKMLTAVGRYTNDIKSDGHFYVESADPFAIVLACQSPNPRHCIAAGSSPDGMTTYRVTVQFKQKMGFVVNYSHKAEHPLMHFIQSALNGHSDPAQFVEALERTCIPMGILASVVESQLLCAKYYRQDPPPSAKDGAANGGPKAFGRGKMGGKGMKLGYKFKLPGEEKGYYAEKSYGGDDKSFVPAELVMIPRSQTHVRLSYGDRCAVDIYFLENQSVKMQSSSGGVRVPSCPSEKGIVVDCQNFAEKLRSTLSEMASA